MCRLAKSIDDNQYNIMYVFGCFVLNFLEHTEDKTDVIYIQDVFQMYSSFMTMNGWKFGLSKRRFFNELRYYCKSNNNLEPFILGWKLKEAKD